MGTQVQPDSGSYTDNVNAGTATVKATVENMELTTSFDIEPYDISGEKVTVEFTPSSATYTGQEQKPTYAVKFGDAPMVENADYTATWSVGEFINAGDYQLVLNGKDGSNFTGTRSATYTIGKATPTFTAPVAKELTYT